MTDFRWTIMDHGRGDCWHAGKRNSDRVGPPVCGITTDVNDPSVDYVTQTGTHQRTPWSEGGNACVPCAEFVATGPQH